MIKIEIYDENAAGQNADGAWPTKNIYLSKSWLNKYAISSTRYRSADELLANYTLDEVDGIEARARAEKAIK